VLGQIGPDIVGLQEVDHLRPRSGSVDQAAYLARSLSMDHVFGAAIHYRTGAYGNAILSKFPFSKTAHHLLPSRREQRACLEAEIIIGTKKLSIFNTHLGLMQQERHLQLQDHILPMVMGKNNPLILSGDFNATETASELEPCNRTLKDTFKQNTGPVINTYPAHEPQIRIDYVFINHFLQCSNFFIVDTLASDHLPATARLRL